MAPPSSEDIIEGVLNDLYGPDWYEQLSWLCDRCDGYHRESEGCQAL